MKTAYTFIFFLLSACAPNVKAQWSTDPNTDSKLNARVYNPLTFCTDGHGGSFYTWSQTFTGQTHDIIINRIDSSGHLRLGDSGIKIHTDTVGQTGAGDPVICEDGKGGCYIAYGNNNLPGHPLVIHHLNANGSNLWADTGKPVTDKFGSQYYQNYYSLLNDNNQGVLVAFNTSNVGTDTSGIYAQRFNLSGQRQWGNHGKRVESDADARYLRIVSDGKRGMALVWANYSFDGLGHQYQLRMNRLNHNGQLCFTAGNKKLNTRVPLGFGPFFRLIQTKNKNFIVIWNADNGRDTLYMQKVDSLGNSLWGSSEIKVADSTGQKTCPDLMSDGAEGVYCLWTDGRRVNVAFGVYAQHVNGNGNKLWKSQGALVDSNTIGGSFTCAYLAPDMNKNIKTFYKASDNRVHLQIINNSGARQIAGNGTAVTAPGHDLIYNQAVLPLLNNHDILFMKFSNGDCYAKYVPLTGVLPLSFTRFSAVSNATENVLNWQTMNEINTRFFSVERSENGLVFAEVAKLAANNNAVNEYSFSDKSATSAAMYYRIKETDNDGNYFYSKTINLHQAIAPAFRIVPNPARGICVLYLDGWIDATAILTLSDMNGKLVKQMSISAKQPAFAINVSDIAAGMYVCNVQTPGKVYTQKLIVIK